jgi:hypothetical protein
MAGSFGKKLLSFNLNVTAVTSGSSCTVSYAMQYTTSPNHPLHKTIVFVSSFLEEILTDLSEREKNYRQLSERRVEPSPKEPKTIFRYLYVFRTS